MMPRPDVDVVGVDISGRTERAISSAPNPNVRDCVFSDSTVKTQFVVFKGDR
jgi:hypothetical protein